MTRFSVLSLGLLLALSPLLADRRDPPLNDFLDHVSLLTGYPSDDPRTLGDQLRQDVSFSEEDTDSVLQAIQDYRTNSAAIEKAVGAIVLERRLATAAGEAVSGPADSELIAELNRKKEKLAELEIESLTERLGATKIEALNRYIESGRSRIPIARRQ